jgi:hypothetical protein
MLNIDIQSQRLPAILKKDNLYLAKFTVVSQHAQNMTENTLHIQLYSVCDTIFIQM